MPTIPTGFGQGTLVFTTPSLGGPAMCTFGFEDASVAEPNVVAEAVYDSWVSTGSMFSRQDTQTILAQANVLIRRAGELVAGTHVEDTAGLLTGVGNAPQVALLVQKQTGFAGRTRRGRFYVPGPSGIVESGTFSSGAHTANQTAAETFLTAFQAQVGPMYLLHVSEVDPPTEVTSLVAQQLGATQRRRIR